MLIYGYLQKQNLVVSFVRFRLLYGPRSLFSVGNFSELVFLDRFTTDQMFVNDSLKDNRTTAVIPYGFWINDCYHTS